MPEPDTTPAACRWPACLTPDQQTQLADEVTASMLGEPTTPMPDQRPICGCVEAATDDARYEQPDPRQPVPVCDRCGHAADEHSIYGCLDECGCPARPDLNQGTSGRSETGATTANPQAGGAEAGDVGADTTASGYTWAQTIASYGTSPTVTIDIDIHAPGHDEPVPVEIGLADARTLHDMLGGVLAEHDGTDLRGRYASCPGYETVPNPCRCPCYGCKHHCSAHQPLGDEDHLRERYAAALRAVVAVPGVTPSPEEEQVLADLTDAVLAVRDQEMQALRAGLAVARATNRRLNYRAQAVESELATYRRAVAQWDVSDRGTYIPHASLIAIGKAAGTDLLGTPRHLRHFARVEQAEAAIERVRAARDRIGHADPRAVDLIWALDQLDDALGIPVPHRDATLTPPADQDRGGR